MRNRRKRPGRLALLSFVVLVFLMILGLYLPALKNGFVLWDDYDYITSNLYIRHLNSEFFSWCMTSFYAGNWHPLTWISHAVDYALFGLNPMGHHLSSILIHAANSVLVFFLLSQFLRFGPASGSSISPTLAAGIGAILFGIHPLHVEAVAWVAERKELLCAFFMLTAALFYLHYRSASGVLQKRVRYTGSLVVFALALMSKPMAVSFPVLLLIIDDYPFRLLLKKGRLSLSVLADKIPFLLLTAASIMMTLKAQAAGGAILGVQQASLWFWILNPFHAVIFYLWKFLLPFGLSPLYEVPPITLQVKIGYLLSTAAVLGITFYAVRDRLRGRPLLLSLWMAFLVMLLPVLGIVKVGQQTAADRYMYISSFPLVLLVGLAFSRLMVRDGRRSEWRPWAIGSLLAVIAVFSFLTVRQIAVWKDPESLWQHAIAVNPENSGYARMELGTVYSKRGDFKRALPYYQMAFERFPKFVDPINELGHDYEHWGRPAEARRQFERSIRVDPGDPAAYNNMALLNLKEKRTEEAIRFLKKSLSIKPDASLPHGLLGAAYLMQGRMQDSARESAEAARLDPMDTSSRENLGRALIRLGRWDEARKVYEELAVLEPENPRIREFLKKISDRAGRR